jgi:effector-binding domain-containing protein
MTLTYEVRAEELHRQLTAVVRGEMPAAEMSTWLPEAYAAVFGYLQSAGVAPVAPPFARFTFLADTVAIEAGVPVATEVAGDDRVEPSSLPEGPAAITTHVGRYEDLEHALDAVVGWLTERGLRPAGPHWEVYYTDPNAEPDPGRWRTEVVVPYRVGQTAH